MNAIFLSIKPEYTKKIESKEKLYELRNFNPKEKIDKFYIYESAPKSQITFIAHVGSPICYPDIIKDYGLEAQNFNSGCSKYKKAYPIMSLYKLKNPIKFKTLKNIYNFSAPQGFAYDARYKELVRFIEESEKVKVF